MKTWICRAALLTALCFWAMPVSVHAEDGYTLFAIEKGSDENIRNAYVVIDGKTGETESVAEEEASAGADTAAGEALFSADPEWHSSLWAADQKNPKEKAPIQLHGCS